MLTEQQVIEFSQNGYIILPKQLDSTLLGDLHKITKQHLAERIEPFELEADVRYPGAPASAESQGGKTIRRLLHAYSRHSLYQDIACNKRVVSMVKQLLRTPALFLNPNHHNCMMTKQPTYSSKTNWHRDTRYWHFNNKYLINAWYAMGDEKEDNGGMLILPGSHRWDIQDHRLDAEQFLIEDLPDNKARLLLAQQVDLQAGDCLLFSAHCFHAAGANKTQQDKHSLVYTYHGESTWGLSNTRSSLHKAIPIA